MAEPASLSWRLESTANESWPAARLMLPSAPNAPPNIRTMYLRLQSGYRESLNSFESWLIIPPETQVYAHAILFILYGDVAFNHVECLRGRSA
ncbi:hypothetical protein Fuma_05020 [Fuerstiella marisgermanici]|uniref:Uncharacterized protein n=1 Tax=Fuerstiella marisgermanici TaxID=1891926 RepID=A0A1P8WMS1_9PLAN|nr:hypothetical protein Fuma_05020 [Fuerstiella marisgermanici]